MSRGKDALKQWKVSQVDVRSLPLWDEFTEAKKGMFAATDTKASPWVVVKSDDKRRARLACMRYVLRSLKYDRGVRKRVAEPDPYLIGPAENLYAKGEIWVVRRASEKGGRGYWQRPANTSSAGRSVYLHAVFLWRPKSLATPRMDRPRDQVNLV